jgi:hypothetical protein
MLLGKIGIAIAETRAEHTSQRRLGHEEVGVLHGDHAATGMTQKKRQKKSIFCLMSPLLKVFFGHGENSVDYSLGGFGNETFRISLRCTGRGQAFCFWAG